MVRVSGSTPQRSCISCRREGEKDSFLRFVLAPDGVVTPDLERKLPGRGCYTCISSTCLLDAAKRRQFGRSFKGVAAAVDAEALDKLLKEQMERRISCYIALANKAGATVSGGESVERTMRGNASPSLLLIAEDVSPAIAEKLESLAKKSSIPVKRLLSKEQFGRLLGKESDRSALLVMSSGFGKSLVKEIERYRNYLQEESGR